MTSEIIDSIPTSDDAAVAQTTSPDASTSAQAEAPVQTANSQPDGFTDGTAVYASVPARTPSAIASRFAAR